MEVTKTNFKEVLELFEKLLPQVGILFSSKNSLFLSLFLTPNFEIFALLFLRGQTPKMELRLFIDNENNLLPTTWVEHQGGSKPNQRFNGFTFMGIRSPIEVKKRKLLLGSFKTLIDGHQVANVFLTLLLHE